MAIMSNWKDALLPDHQDQSGDLPTARGTDPLVDLAGSGAAQYPWTDMPFKPVSGEESSNSVSGLPSMPARFQPTEAPPAMPTLEDRVPSTIDKK